MFMYNETKGTATATGAAELSTGDLSGIIRLTLEGKWRLESHWTNTTNPVFSSPSYSYIEFDHKTYTGFWNNKRYHGQKARPEINLSELPPSGALCISVCQCVLVAPV